MVGASTVQGNLVAAKINDHSLFAFLFFVYQLINAITNDDKTTTVWAYRGSSIKLLVNSSGSELRSRIVQYRLRSLILLVVVSAVIVRIAPECNVFFSPAPLLGKYYMESPDRFPEFNFQSERKELKEARRLLELGSENTTRRLEIFHNDGCCSQDSSPTKQIFEKLAKRRLLPPKSLTNVSDALNSIFEDAGIDEVDIPHELSVASWENSEISDSLFTIPYPTATCISGVLLDTDFTFVVADSNVQIIRNDQKAEIEYAEIHDVISTNAGTREVWSAFVRSVIAPQCWKSNGGESEITLFDDIAIVEATETVHEQITALNHFLRCYTSKQAGQARK